MSVYLSYAAADGQLASKVNEVLTGFGLDVFFDKTILFPGDNWALKIGQALESSDAMVVLVSHAYAESASAKNELSFALGNLSYRHRVIPVVAGEHVPDNIPWPLKKFPIFKIDERKIDLGLQPVADILTKAAA